MYIIPGVGYHWLSGGLIINSSAKVSYNATR